MTIEKGDRVVGGSGSEVYKYTNDKAVMEVVETDVPEEELQANGATPEDDLKVKILHHKEYEKEEGEIHYVDSDRVRKVDDSEEALSSSSSGELRELMESILPPEVVDAIEEDDAQLVDTENGPAVAVDNSSDIPPEAQEKMSDIHRRIGSKVTLAKEFMTILVQSEEMGNTDDVLDQRTESGKLVDRAFEMAKAFVSRQELELEDAKRELDQLKEEYDIEE